MNETPIKKHFIGNLFTVTGDPFYVEKKTPDAVRCVLSELYLMRTLRSRRVRVWYGNEQTGRAWNDMHNVAGYIGRTLDRYPRPALMSFKSSVEGEVLTTNKIVRIDIVETGETVYAHDNFHVATLNTLANVRESEGFERFGSFVRQCWFKLSAVLAR